MTDSVEVFRLARLCRDEESVMSCVLPEVSEEVFAPVGGQVEAMITTVREAAQTGTAAHTLEQGLFQQLLRLGHCLFQSFLTLSGPGDAGERLKREDGREVKRLAPRPRPYRNLVGEYRIERYFYGQREGQRLEAIPLYAPVCDELCPEHSRCWPCAALPSAGSAATSSPFASVKIFVDSMDTKPPKSRYSQRSRSEIGAFGRLHPVPSVECRVSSVECRVSRSSTYT
ncbi:hypothetical protein [Thiorhodococcus minor]|uniref:Uncharacterized protein n=1 Tax=Thiorhodococcus minor TaxID=57489 RepID=A0A6M0K9J0_9GAMM|nr:hypothetical protein [Thiorhodococcus minor]NEV65215.1 hypothetical protein [Thiorhodococcus minor]